MDVDDDDDDDDEKSRCQCGTPTSTTYPLIRSQSSLSLLLLLLLLPFTISAHLFTFSIVDEHFRRYTKQQNACCWNCNQAKHNTIRFVFSFLLSTGGKCQYNVMIDYTTETNAQSSYQWQDPSKPCLSIEPELQSNNWCCLANRRPGILSISLLFPRLSNIIHLSLQAGNGSKPSFLPLYRLVHTDKPVEVQRWERRDLPFSLGIKNNFLFFYFQRPFWLSLANHNKHCLSARDIMDVARNRFLFNYLPFPTTTATTARYQLLLFGWELLWKKHAPRCSSAHHDCNPFV